MSERVPPPKEARASVLATLKAAQSRFGYLPAPFISELAQSLDVAVNDVYGIASFYSFLGLKPQGRHIIRVCRSLPCFLKNGQVIAATVEKEIGIRPGETTSDGRFSFQLTNCIGLCDKAPAMLINSDPHTDLTPEKISRILQEYR